MAKIRPLMFNMCALALVLGLMLNGCSQGLKGTAKLFEGKVSYKITYPPQIESNTLSFLYPKEMVVSFKNDMKRVTVSGSLSLYSLDFIHSSQSDSFFTLLKVLEKKLYVPPTPKSDDIFLFQNYANETVVFMDGDDRKIAGFSCKKAVIVPTNTKLPGIAIWYTNDFGIKNPNRNSPFKKIPGLILEFEVSYQGIPFHFKADKITQKEIPDEFFRVPDDYSASTISEIEGLIQGVLQ